MEFIGDIEQRIENIASDVPLVSEDAMMVFWAMAGFAVSVWILLHAYDFLSRFFLFKKMGIKRWKALIPFYGGALKYKALDMSGLWVFSQVPLMLVSIFSLSLPVWLMGVVLLLDYGVDVVFAVHFTKAFRRKWKAGVLAFFIPRTMQLIAAFSKGFKYDKHMNRLFYAKVGDKYVPASEKKKARAALAEKMRAEEKAELLSEPELEEKGDFLKKITDGIVKHHKAVLAVMLALAAVCVVLMTRVNVNKDLTKYMPESSETSQGLNIMYTEYESSLAMPLSVMVEGLDDTEKQTEYEYLKGLPGVKSISYDDTEKYNKDNQTLYELTINGKADAEVASTAFETIKSHYRELGKEAVYRGEVSTMNSSPLEVWVVGVAVLAALVILIIMAESYVEPVLYLVAIGLAVAINMGTNAFLPSVSQITNSITAVLQLALSMDYSIMLATEYHREKMRGKDKITAMKAALGRSFTAISASSVTTIVGMLVLLLMSFTIGRDLGIVLAKGVLLCLISIFTALPALLLIFDGLVEKTKKTAFAPKLDLLGEASYKIRKFAPLFFLVVMGVSFVAQMQVRNLYANTGNDAIDSVFGSYNQTVVLYNRADEEAATELCKKLDAEEVTSQVLCYGNTINEPVRATELKAQLAKLGSEVEMSDDKVKFLYYHYFDKDETHRIALAELVNYLLDAKGELASRVTPEIREKLEKLRLFTDAEEAGIWRSTAELSSILGMSADKLQDVMVLADSGRETGEAMTLTELAEYLRSLEGDEKYGAMLPSGIEEKLQIIDALKWVADEVGTELLNRIDGIIDGSGITDADIRELMTEFEVSAEKQDEIITYARQGRYALRAIANDYALTSSEITENLGVGERESRLLYALHAQQNGRGIRGMSLARFVYYVRDYVMNSEFGDRLTDEQKSKIYAIGDVLDLRDEPLSASSLYDLISPLSGELSKSKLEVALIYHGAETALPADFTMTVEKVVEFLNGTILKDSRLDEVIDSSTREKAAEAEIKIADAKVQLIAENYGRIVVRANLDVESDETFAFMQHIRDEINAREFSQPAYVIGNSAMAYEMSKTFPGENLMITIVTAIAIYVVVALSFKSWSIPLLLVSIIQTAVWITMTITGLTDGSIYFLALIIVQSLLMGATIDYAIMYTEQYVAARERGLSVKDAVATAYNKAIQAILTSAGVLTIVTAIVGNLATDTTAKICRTISDGTFFSTVLILLMLPALMAACDRFIIRRKK